MSILITNFLCISYENIFIYRNRSKGEALDAKSKMLFILKTMFDAISRILIFSIWLYVSNEGQFSSWTTFGAFYILIAVMFAFNVIFNDSKNICSFAYLIGRFSLFIAC